MYINILDKKRANQTKTTAKKKVKSVTNSEISLKAPCK